MIIQFKCRETRKIWEGERSLRIPPSNRLEALQGKRQDEFSIRINKQWRICFKWLSGNAYEVKIEDYH